MKKIIIALLVLALAILLFTQISEIQRFLDPELLKSTIESFGIFGPAVFIVMYFTAVMLFISSTIFTILGGVLFGKLWGSIYVIFAATLAAQVAFFVGRRLSGKKISALKSKRGIGTLVKTIEAKTDKNGAVSVFVLRALFLPYIALSYAAGTIPTLKARDFFLGTFFSNIIFVPAFVYLGESLLKGPKALIIPVIMIMLVLSVPKIVKKFQK